MAAVSLPEVLGRLRRVKRIGAGGFATVWLYRDEDLQSDVAVKALADNWAQRFDIRERFLEEARILRRADSDHVVRVHDIGEHEGTPWFVMTYADLGSLEPWVGTPMEPARVVDLVSQAGTGLGVLHQQGIIHRDIKPQNLLLRSEPRGDSAGERLMVADLGLAKAMLHASGLTQVVGTPAYMAPEQARGLGVDLRADVHALAAVAYTLLTGRTVRDVGLEGLPDAGPPPAPSTLAAVPSAVDDVLLAAVSTDPDQRPDSVAELVESFRAAMGAASVTVPDRGRSPAPVSPAAASAPADAASPAARTTRSGPSPLALAAWSLLVLVATFAAAYAVATRLL